MGKYANRIAVAQAVRKQSPEFREAFPNPLAKKDKKVLPDWTVETGPKRVWRLEHGETGVGPFVHPSGVNRYLSIVHVVFEPRYSEIGSAVGSNAIFACDNPFLALCMMERPIYFREHGFVYREYEVQKHMLYRDGQVAFQRDEAKLIQTYSIPEFHHAMDDLMEGYSWELESRASLL